MRLNAHVDVELVAVEQPDELTVMLELRAPEAPQERPRPPAAVQVVLDRSGSMHGERLEAAQRALLALVDRLDPSDRFGVVAFDDTADVVVPAGPAADKAALKHAIAALGPGGMTNLSGGLLRGLQEARRVAPDAGATLLLVSDGHANEGILDPERLAAVAAKARDARRHDLDGRDRARLRRDAAGGARDAPARAATRSPRTAMPRRRPWRARSRACCPRRCRPPAWRSGPTGDVQAITVWNDLPSHAIEGGVVVELGDLWAGEERKLLVTLAVPAMPSLGLAQVATLELTYVALPDLAEQTVTLPVHVNVVPGDQAAGRVPDPKVRTELLFQRAQQAKRRAAEALGAGDVHAARAAYREAAADIAAAPPSSGARRRRPRSSAGSTRYVAQRRGASGGEAEPDGARPQEPPARAPSTVRCRSVRSCPAGPTKGVWV